MSQSEYLDTTISSGLKVFIHDQNHVIFSETEGYSLSPSFAVDIALKYVLMKFIYTVLYNCCRNNNNFQEEIQKYPTDCESNASLENFYYRDDYSYEVYCTIFNYDFVLLLV